MSNDLSGSSTRSCPEGGRLPLRLRLLATRASEEPLQASKVNQVDIAVEIEIARLAAGLLGRFGSAHTTHPFLEIEQVGIRVVVEVRVNGCHEKCMRLTLWVDPLPHDLAEVVDILAP